jgi:hypothetical protein
MISRKDKDIIGSVTNASATACFRTGEDVFFIIDYRIPPDGVFTKSKEAVLQASGYVFYSRYKEGVLDNIEVVAGLWIKRPDELSFSSTPGGSLDSAQENVSDTEIQFNYSFENLSKTQTTYSTQIRRSTLRFVEEYRWGKNDKDNTSGESSNRGYCTEFKQPKP